VQEEVGVHAAVQTSDWTYSTPYKGTVCRHDSHEAPTNVTVSRTENEIPVHRLRQDNPIVYYDEIILYEDELDDCGSSRFNIRFRAMADCWFALVRYYLRVDGVLVRIYDTRIFHSLDSTEILREF
jgi:type 2A phosphatase activator TIP41